MPPEPEVYECLEGWLIEIIAKAALGRGYTENARQFAEAWWEKNYGATFRDLIARMVNPYADALESITLHAYDDTTSREDLEADFDAMKRIAHKALEGGV